MENRYRLYFIELYKDTNSYNFDEVFRNLKSYKKWAYIVHDKDKNENGDYKKLHYHFILHLDNACTPKALSKKIGLSTQFIQNIRNERSVVRYLIHIDDDDKYQYSKNDIITSKAYSRFVSKCFDDLETEEEMLSNIFSTIDSIMETTHNYSTILFALISYVNANCYDTIYKRYRYEFNEYIKQNI